MRLGEKASEKLTFFCSESRRGRLIGYLHNLFGEVIGQGLKRPFWLPGHVWVGRALLVGKTFHQAVTGHVEIIFWIFVVIQSRRDKSEHKSAINAYIFVYIQHISEFACL